MPLYLVRPDLMYFERYNDMMTEWNRSGTQIAPWFLGDPFPDVAAYARHVRMLDACRRTIPESPYAATDSYYAVDGEGRLVGAASLRLYLTEEGLAAWGHIGYGVRPSERGKGTATAILRLMLGEAEKAHIREILLGAHETNAASRRVIEKSGGMLLNTVPDPNAPEKNICRYRIMIR